MTFNVGSIQGGTNAGWKRVKEAPKSWRCTECESVVRYAPELPGYRVQCDVGHRRGN